MTGPRPWRARVAAWFGRDPQRSQLSTECRQCGGWISVILLRLSGQSLRYWCYRCGAVVTTTRRLVNLVPTAQLRAPVSQPPAQAAAEPAGDELQEVMSAAMVRWLRSRKDRLRTVNQLDKANAYQRYRQWDAHLQKLGVEAAQALAHDGEPLPVPGLPAFSAVVGALHNACYHEDIATQSLADANPPATSAALEALRERVTHARRWLSHHRDDHCWIIRGCPPEGLAEPDSVVIKAAVAGLRAGTELDRATRDAARAAAFGTIGGPALPTLLIAYPAPELLAALERYLESGVRVLRDDVIARLDARGATTSTALGGNDTASSIDERG